MGFLRGIFLFALVMLGIGVIGTHYLLTSLFSPAGGAAPGAVAMVLHRPTSTPVHAVAGRNGTHAPGKGDAHRHGSVRTTHPSTTTRKPAATPSSTRVATIHMVSRHRRVHRNGSVKARRRAVVKRPEPTATPTATPQPSPTPTPMSGTVSLTNYWVGSSTAQPGQTVSIGYVINNGTGHTVRVTLGASIKSSRSVSWLSGQINDPYHDVVATVPPGISTHIRYFTVPARLRAGSYDVAWGLSNALTGSRESLVAAVGALRIHG